MTVAELLARVSSHELSEWLEYYKLEPFGQERDNLHAGLVASTIANVNRDADRQAEPYKPRDFMLQFETQAEDIEPPPVWQSQLAFVEMLNAAMGGLDLRKKR